VLEWYDRHRAWYNTGSNEEEASNAKHFILGDSELTFAIYFALITDTFVS